MRFPLIAVCAVAMLAACAKKADEAVPASDTPTVAEAESVNETPSESSYPHPALPLEGGGLPCVKEVPSDSICTMDLNQCGHSGSCNCGEGYQYNAAMGKCLLVLDGVSEASKVDVADDECVKAPAAACTRDINVCGQPSNCQCDEGFMWNDVAGKCLKAS